MAKVAAEVKEIYIHAGAENKVTAPISGGTRQLPNMIGKTDMMPDLPLTNMIGKE